ncbi:hypothetical protein [Acinetobacter proteolyticus]|uniref:Lysozyme inhibitor LprI N-terminal domain-containing protein n=1 Tax=Acinetobacter proteolyticus TaxID=1776741 RepID=A0A2N0WEW5_9GAMM|nr:hypothetical protein [Acinetobacter proteolyticus]PKF33406.1 hypothetical protein CW311_11425 [Acinetobacter proteolyticus]
MKLFTFIICLVTANTCFALTPEEFEQEYVRLKSELNRAVLQNAIDSRDYNDEKIPEEEKFQSQSSWCKLAKKRVNLLDFVVKNYPDYKELMKKNNQDDDSTLKDFKKFYKSQNAMYLRLNDALKDTEYKCE